MPKIRNYLDLSISSDLRTLGLTRIIFSLLIITDLLIRWSYLSDHYTGSGVLPISALFEHYWKIGYVSVHTLSDGYLYQLILFIISLFSALMLLIGWKTKLFTIISWFLLASVNTRNPLIIQAGDVLFRCLMFWAIFMPWGERFSLDSFLRGKDKRGGSNHILSAGQAAFMFQVLFMYFFTALIKDHPVWNENYEAIYYALSMEQFSWFLGSFVYDHPGMMKALTFSVFWIELIGPFIFLIPFRNSIFRYLGILIFGMLQLGLILTMWLGLFPLISTAAILIFLPSDFWDRFKAVENFIDRIYMKVFRFTSPVRNSLPGIPSVINLDKKWLLKLKNVFVVLLLVYVFYWNLTTLNKSPLEIPDGMNWIARVFRIDQKWNMFAPHPVTNDGWFVIIGQMRNGDYMDLVNEKKYDGAERPDDFKSQYSNYRWRKYIRNILSGKNDEYRPYFGKYLCGNWNRKRAESQKLMYVEMFYMEEKTLPDYKTEKEQRKFIFKYNCEDNKNNTD